MPAHVKLQSKKNGELNRFLSLFYDTNLDIDNKLKWDISFENPIEVTDIIGAFADNIDAFDIKMWISLDKDVFIKISDKNVNSVIKYIFERYPY